MREAVPSILSFTTKIVKHYTIYEQKCNFLLLDDFELTLDTDGL